VQPVGAWAVYLLCALGATLMLVPAGRRASGALFAFLAVLGCVMLFLLDAGRYLETGAPLLAAVAAVGIRFVDDAVAQARERAMLRNSFGSYVSPQIMSEILAGRITPELGGKRALVCILFSDVRNFTRRSEHMPPEELIGTLNEYFTEMTQCVHEHGGTVDKFIGDGMMCFFGAPQPLANACDAAVAAGKEMLVRLQGLNERFRAQGREPVSIGIGLHFGEVVLGHVGSNARHEYTAIGDAVNTASRVEGLTKGVGYALAISSDVWARLTDKDEWEALGEQKVKGRAAVSLYGHIGSRTEDNEDGEQTWIGMLGSRQ
jgi:adenylate cyclase